MRKKAHIGRPVILIRCQWCKVKMPTGEFYRHLGKCPDKQKRKIA